MPDVGTPSLDQLRVLLTVVEEGSFAAAGRRLSRATSAVSYTIGQLERQLGVALFDRAAHTQAGSHRSWRRPVAKGARGLRRDRRRAGDGEGIS